VTAEEESAVQLLSEVAVASISASICSHHIFVYMSLSVHVDSIGHVTDTSDRSAPDGQYNRSSCASAVTEIKEDLKGKKEFEDYLTKLQIEKSDIQDRIEKNKAWIVSGRGNTINSRPAQEAAP